MPINVSYAPNAGLVAGAGYQSGLGGYQRWLAEQAQQKAMQAESIKDAQYRQSVDLAQQKYLTETGRTFDASQNDASRANQQYLAQLGIYGDQSGRQQQAIYSGQLDAQQQAAAQQRQMLQMAFGDYSQQQDNAAAAARLGQQQRFQAAQQQYGGQLDAQQQFRQAALQSGLSSQQSQQQYGMARGLNEQEFGQRQQLQQDQFGQQNALAGMQQQFGMQDRQQQFDMTNFLGQYQGQLPQAIANQAKLQASGLQSKLMALQQYADGRPGFDQTPEYKQAYDGLYQQFTGLQKSIPNQKLEREQQIAANLHQIPLPDGSMLPVWLGHDGVPQPMVNTAAIQQKAQELEFTQQKTAALSNMVKLQSAFLLERTTAGADGIAMSMKDAVAEWNKYMAPMFASK